jgi:tripartite-type tricarboxylate transporter receptor subunit TctC
MTAVLGGHIAATAATAAVAAPQIRSGAMRALVNTGARRVALLPDVPTALELGLANVEFYLWVGIFSQPATTAAEREAWRQATEATTKDPEMLRQLEAAGLELDHRDGKAFQDFLDADFERVQAAVNRIGRVE